MSHERKPTHLDLFSGIGGFALAAGWAGFTTVGFAEIEQYPSKNCLAHFWPDVSNYGDITALDGKQFAGSIDLVTGGFPCQPFSCAGKRGGDSDERFLWPHLARILGEVRPRFALLENVPGLLSIDGGRTFNRILADLAALGFDALWNCIPASAVGANHRRDRIWIVCHRVGELRNDSTQQGGICLERQSLDSPGREEGSNEVNGSSRHVAHPESQRSAEGRGFRCDRPEERVAGRSEDVSYANGTGPLPPSLAAIHRGEEGSGPRHGEFERHSGNASHTSLQGLPQPEFQTLQREGRRQERRATPERNWWLTEPAVGRVAHGVPKRVDRLKGLGNAIVPEVAYLQLEAIAEVLRHE